MSNITKLEDIQVYVEARLLAQEVYKLIKTDPVYKDYSLVDQIKRASLSVMANIAEGYGRKTKKDFSQFLSISLGSANEVIAFLDFIRVQYLVNTSNLMERYATLSKRIYTFRAYLLTHN